MGEISHKMHPETSPGGGHVECKLCDRMHAEGAVAIVKSQDHVGERVDHLPYGVPRLRRID